MNMPTCFFTRKKVESEFIMSKNCWHINIISYFYKNEKQFKDLWTGELIGSGGLYYHEDIDV